MNTRTLQHYTRNTYILSALLAFSFIFAVLAITAKVNGASGGLMSRDTVNDLAESRKLAQMLIDMKSIHLDGHLFETPAFMSLVDFSQEYKEEPVGRPDPFAPLDTTDSLDGSGTTITNAEALDLFIEE